MRKTLAELKKAAAQGEKLACLTAYDATFAYWSGESGIDVILVGDSLGMVVQGHETTLPVSMDEMVYHTQMVQRGNRSAWCIADLPFMADATPEAALTAAARLMKEGRANMVKLEGGQRVLTIVQSLSDLGVPVCGHLGLLPQSVEKHGYKVKGRDESSAQRILKDALALERAGADMLVLECVPSVLAEEITLQTGIPVIGIGSGNRCNGQVLVLQDILGITVGKTPKFSKNFLAGRDSIPAAIEAYATDVKSGLFPDSEHTMD